MKNIEKPENTPVLYTKRLILRKFQESDLDAFFCIYSDAEVNTFLPWFPIQSQEEAKKVLREAYLDSYEAPQGYRYAVCLKEDDCPVGYVNVSCDDSHDLGYGLRKEFWHRGIITEAAKAVTEQAKKDGLPFITATHDEKNPRSGAVMRRLGMDCKYSYEEQWQPKNRKVLFHMYQLNFRKDREDTYMKYWDTSEVHFRREGHV